MQTVHGLQQRLDASFDRVDGIRDPELMSDFAKYLCVLVSGFLETAVAALVLEHARHRGAPTLQRFVDSKAQRFVNPKMQRLRDFLGSFDPEWRSALEQLPAEQTEAVDSVVNLRNKIAHGESVGLTYGRMKNYYSEILKVLNVVERLCT